MSKSVSISNEEKAQEAYRSAMTLFKRGFYSEAISACALGLRAQPRDWRLWDIRSDLEGLVGLSKESTRSSVSARRHLLKQARIHRDRIDIQLETAAVLNRTGQYRLAAEQMLSAARKNPDSPLICAALALCRLREERLDDAYAAARRAAELDPKCFGALWVQGACLALRRQWHGALEWLKRASNVSPESAEPYIWRAAVLALSGQQGGVKFLDRGLRISDGRWDVLARGLLRKIVAGEPVNPAQCRLIGISATENETSEGRRIALIGRIMSRVTRHHVHFKPTGSRSNRLKDELFLIQAQLLSGKISPILREFKRVIKRRPADGLPYMHRAEVFLWIGNYQAARRDLERALRLDPNLRWARVGLAAVDLLTGRPRLTLDRLNEARRLGALPSVTWVWRGEALRLLGRWSEAAKELKAAARHSRLKPSVWINLALAQGASGNRPAQRKLFSELARQAPDLISEAAACSRADMRLAAGWPDRTLDRVLESALKLMKGNRSSWAPLYFDRRGRLRNIHID